MKLIRDGLSCSRETRDIERVSVDAIFLYDERRFDIDSLSFLQSESELRHVIIRDDFEIQSDFFSSNFTSRGENKSDSFVVEFRHVRFYISEN